MASVKASSITAVLPLHLHSYYQPTPFKVYTLTAYADFLFLFLKLSLQRRSGENLPARLKGFPVSSTAVP